MSKRLWRKRSVDLFSEDLDEVEATESDSDEIFSTTLPLANAKRRRKRLSLPLKVRDKENMDSNNRTENCLVPQFQDIETSSKSMNLSVRVEEDKQTNLDESDCNSNIAEKASLDSVNMDELQIEIPESPISETEIVSNDQCQQNSVTLESDVLQELNEENGSLGSIKRNEVEIEVPESPSTDVENVIDDQSQQNSVTSKNDVLQELDEQVAFCVKPMKEVLEFFDNFFETPRESLYTEKCVSISKHFENERIGKFFCLYF